MTDAAARCAVVIERLQATGLDVLYADFSPPAPPGSACLRAIVPGLEVETMSYRRIGARNTVRLLAERGVASSGAARPPPAHYQCCSRRQASRSWWPRMARSCRPRPRSWPALHALPRAGPTRRRVRYAHRLIATHLAVQVAVPSEIPRALPLCVSLLVLLPYPNASVYQYLSIIVTYPNEYLAPLMPLRGRWLSCPA